MKQYEVLCYTRHPEEDAVYSAKLAYSMHLAVNLGTGHFEPLNHNGGVLYVKATQNEDGTLNAMSLKNPWLFKDKGDSYGVIAERIEAFGKEDTSSKGKLVYFVSKDLLSYEERPLIEIPEEEYVEDAICEYVEELGEYIVSWTNGSGASYQLTIEALEDISASTEKQEIQALKVDFPQTAIKGAIPRNILEIPKETALRLYHKLTVPVNVANEVPELVKVSSLEDMKKVKAVARYSDGSSVLKPVDWRLDEVDFTKAGTYEITGRVHQEHYEFPIAVHRADPCVARWQGKYYYIATNDADGNHTLYIREADTIPGLVNAPEILLLDTKTYAHIGNLLWAPEFHIIKGKLYIFHAATPGEFVHEQSHVMMLKENGNPMNREDWTMPQRVIRKDGSMLYDQGITLDMTVFELNDNYYAMWSQRQFTPVDQGAWLYIAQINPEEPWKLITDPVLISMPEYGWANNHTFVDEGPFALITDQKLFVTFSSAAVDSTYVVGLLTAELDADPLNPSSWTKCNYPLMSCRTKEGEYGTGHNAYIEDEDGLIWNTYHAKVGVDGPRSTGFRRVHFDVEGYPVLEMTAEKDLKEELAEVKLKVTVL